MLRTLSTLGAISLLAACAGAPPQNASVPPAAVEAKSAPATAPSTPAVPAANAISIAPTKPRAPKLDPERAVYFPATSFDLSNESMNTLRKYAARLNGDRRLVVMLVGSSDDLGSKEMCVAIANKRVAAVEEELLNLGVRQQQIRKVARGCEAVSDLACTADNCRQQYRRVDLRIANS